MTFKRSADSDTSILELAVRDAVDAFWYWNFEEKAGWVSDRWYELTGVPKGDGTPSIDVWSEIVDQEDLPRVHKALIAHLKQRQPYDVEFRLMRPNETRIWVRARAQATWDNEGRAIRFAGSMVDIDALKQAQNASHLIAERFHGLCEASTDGILIVDEHSLILYSNPAVERIFGRVRNEMFGRNLEMLQPERLRTAHTMGMSLYMQTSVRKLNWDSVETTGLRADGCEFPIEITLAELQTPGSRNFVAFVRDITRRREAEQRIKYLALHDSLTGLLNRNSIEEKTAEAIGAAERAGSLVAVMYVDLDRFKPINDWLGHAAGDELLMQVAERILRAMPSSAFVGRQGGDEFIVVLPTHRAEAASEAANALLEGLKGDFDIGEQTVQVGASVGISVYPHDGTFPQELLAYADEAMYFAKAAGRNRLKLYSAEMSEKAAHRLHIEHELRSAIERRELSIVYQPLYALANNRVVGAEALLRWHHHELGVVEPVDFIPVAESSGLIIPLGEWVLIEACAQLARWRKAGMTELTVAVNVSARQLLQPNLLRLIRAALASASLPGSSLILEITESSLIEHPDEVAGVLRALAELGVASSIDDFGTGFSSLSYLKRFPLAQIKIDRSFIQDVTTDRNDAAIVNAVIAMGRSLGLTVIAEGVETEAQALYLRGQGCHHVQGYWFARPLTVDEFTKRLIV